MTIKAMRDAKRAEYVEMLMKMLNEAGEDAERTGSGELNMPVVLEDGTEDWIVVKVSIPTGSRLDGEAYDGYGARTDYTIKQDTKAAKAKEAAAKKAAKIAKDKAARDAKKAKSADSIALPLDWCDPVSRRRRLI